VKDVKVKGIIRFFDRPDPVVTHPGWFHGSFYTDKFRRINCEHRIVQVGVDLAGRRNRPRQCRTGATYMRWDAASLWHRPLCLVHWRKNIPTPPIKEK
jgi:hypothetical protein